MSMLIQQIPTRYIDNENNTNSIIDLMFLQSNNLEFNNHCILPQLRQPSDHVPLCVTVNIISEDINFSQRIIPKDSNKEVEFVDKCTEEIRNINIEDI